MAEQDRAAVVGIDHVQLAIPVGGEDEARSFFVDLLGFDEVPKPPVLALRGGCWFRSGSVEVHCGVEEPFRPARKAHVALRVEGYAALCRRLEEAGLPVAPDEDVPGVVRCHTADPFGNRIELVSADH
jgi:catechol 2,3-dioxygenase-like lactoylglutathione lyase family enzyme